MVVLPFSGRETQALSALHQICRAGKPPIFLQSEVTQNCLKVFKLPPIFLHTQNNIIPNKIREEKTRYYIRHHSENVILYTVFSVITGIILAATGYAKVFNMPEMIFLALSGQLICVLASITDYILDHKVIAG